MIKFWAFTWPGFFLFNYSVMNLHLEVDQKRGQWVMHLEIRKGHDPLAVVVKSLNGKDFFSAIFEVMDSIRETTGIVKSIQETKK